MKRTPLNRKTPLKQGKPLERKTRLAPVSKRRRQVQRQRVEMVKTELAKRELCEAGTMIYHGGHHNRCEGLSVELHEPLTRARGGSILEPANTVAVCRCCHDWIHNHPTAATELGLLRSADPNKPA